MSFLCILATPPGGKKNTSESSRSSITANQSKLGQLLCPYEGYLQRIDLDNGFLYLSDLAAYEFNHGAHHCLIPKNSVCNPQTSWMQLLGDKRGLVFQTDPMGTFPIWYYQTEDRLIVTSEVKSLLALDEPVDLRFRCEAINESRKRPADFSPYQFIKRLPPGAQLTVGADLGVKIEGGLPLDYRPNLPFDCMDTAKEQLAQALKASSESIPASVGKIATFLSGGIDSSIATALMDKQSAIATFTLGTEFGDEYADAADLSSYLDIPHTRVYATQADAKQHFERAIFCNETIDGLSAETLAQLSMLASAASQGVKHVVTGYGADLLFGSMLRHELYMQVTGVDDLQSLIERTCWTGEFSPFFAWSLGIELHHLFWDPRVMNCAFRIPDDANFDGEREKVLMRTLAVEQGWMSESHAFRKKHAMTDGTQFNRVLSEVFGLADKFSYGAKDRLCINQLRKLFESDSLDSFSERYKDIA